MRPLYFISSGFHLATPAYDDTGQAHIVLTPIVYFTPLYDTDDEDDPSHTYEQPMPQGGWENIEHPEHQQRLRFLQIVRGENQLPKVVQGIKFQNGIEVIKMSAHHAA